MSLFDPKTVADRSLQIQSAIEERRQRLEMEAKLGAAMQELAKTQEDLVKALEGQQTIREDAAKQASVVQAQRSIDEGKRRARIDALVSCLQWARDRDRTWRGVAIATVDAKLDEVIRG